MNLKEFDYKQFLLEKGEKLGLAIAVAVMVLLILWLFLPGHGFVSGSPVDNAKSLKDLHETLTQKLKSNTPSGNDLPPPDAEANMIPLNTTRVDGRDFPLAGLFEGRKLETIKRRLPTLLNIDEARVAYTYAPIDGYVFSQDHTQITALKPLSGSAGTNSLTQLAPGVGPRGGRGGSGGMGPGMGPGGIGPGGRGGFGGGGRGMLPGRAAGLEDRKKQYDLLSVKLADLGKTTGVIPARQLYPLRMAIIAGSFPLRAQLEEFRTKMRFNSIDEVLAQEVTIKDGKKQPAVHFLGVHVQRRTLDPSGREIEPYRDLDLAAAYKPWLFMTGRRFEPEDPKLAFVSWPGLVMPKLQEFRFSADGREPDKKDLDNHYPAVEEEVKNIEKVLKELKKSQTAEITIPPQFKSDEEFDPFHPQGFEDPSLARRQGFGPGAGPGGPGMGPGGPGMGPGGGVPSGMPDPTAYRRRGPGGWGRPTSSPDNTPTPRSRSTTPEHCLVRLIDITIEPGQIYQYRLQVRMANPLFGRPDVANPAWAQEEELHTSKWFEVPQTVAVPPELAYYAVDQKELEKNYKGTNSGAVNPSTDSVLQIHRWLGEVQIKGMGLEPWLIGEWAVADRVIASRGEYVDRTVRIELPVWSYTQNTFVIGTDPTNRNAKQTGIDVDFKNNQPPKYQTILIDFEGGNKQKYKMSYRLDEDTVKEAVVTDTSGTDVLLMDPHGNLLGHNSLVDTEDPDRTHRREQVLARVERVKTKGGGPQPAGTRPGDKPFGK
jgi:hypothetical protein